MMNTSTPILQLTQSFADERPEKFLTANDDQRLANWALQMQASGFRLTRDTLCQSAALMIKNHNKVKRFRTPVCQMLWCQTFLKQYAYVRLFTNADHIEWKASEWFAMVRSHLTERNIGADVLLDANRVFCFAEIAFALQLKAGGGAVLEKKGEHRVRNADCDEVTAILGGNAAGTLTPPMVLFDRLRMPKLENDHRMPPPAWAIATTDTGWMTATTLYDYLVDTFHPWLLNRHIALPVIVFVDGHSTHVTHVLSEFCDRGQIVLLGLPATETNAIQPLDLCVLGPLMSAWRDTLAIAPNNVIAPGDFCATLADVIDRNVGRELFEYAFKVCGVFPFPIFGSPVRKKAALQRKRSGRKDHRVSVMQHCLDYLEEVILERNPEFDDAESAAAAWTGDADDASFYQLWKEIKADQLDENVENELSTANSETTSDIENRLGQRLQAHDAENTADDETEVLRFCLTQLEEQVGGKLATFEEAKNGRWHGAEEDESLFILWRGLKDDLEKCEKRRIDVERLHARGVLREPPHFVCQIHPSNYN